MKNIIVPTDFSDHANYAMNVAADICRKEKDCTLHLVHVYEKPLTGFTMQIEINREELHKVRAEMHVKLDHIIKEELADIKVDKTVVADIPVKEILSLDVMKNADLIVMGTHGVKGWKELLIGSNAQRVVRNASCPVLVVKKELHNFDLKNVILASDFLEPLESGYDKIEKIIGSYNPVIHLVKVSDPEIAAELDESDAKIMDDFIEKHGLSNATSNYISAVSVEKGVEKIAADVDADCVIIETHGRIGVDRFMLGSVAETLVNHLDQPVLTVKLD